MLSSTDPTVVGIALAELLQTVRYATQDIPTPTLVSCYLSSTHEPRWSNMRYQTQSLWTRTRKASGCLQIHIQVPEIGQPTISTESEGPIQPLDVCRFLHFYVRDHAAYQLLQLND